MMIVLMDNDIVVIITTISYNYNDDDAYDMLLL